MVFFSNVASFLRRKIWRKASRLRGGANEGPDHRCPNDRNTWPASITASVTSQPKAPPMQGIIHDAPSPNPAGTRTKGGEGGTEKPLTIRIGAWHGCTLEPVSLALNTLIKT